MVKWKSCSASNGVFWVRVLVEVLKELRKGHPNGDGNRLEAGRAFLQLPCGFNSRSFRSRIVKRRSRPGPNGAPFAFLGGGFDSWSENTWCSWCSGFCMSACEAEGGGSIPFEHPIEKETIVVAMLSRQTLVLNRNSQPVGVATVARSLTLVAAERARIVDPADFQQYTWSDWSKLTPQGDELFVQSVTFRIRVPEVITLTEYDRVPSNAVTFSRRNIYKRDRYTCQYCGAQPGSEELTLDHVQPRSRGGTSTWENCVLACLECNKRKADRTPTEAHMPLRKTPVRPTWKPLYARHDVRIESWSKFLSEAYWTVELDA